MSLTADEIIKVLERARELGISQIKVEGFEATLGKQAFPVDNTPGIPDEEVMKFQSPLDNMTDEELLYYATPYYDELQAKKAEHQKIIDEERSIRG